MRRVATIIAIMILVGCSTAKPNIAVPKLPDETRFMDKLHDSPTTLSDIVDNMIVLEHMYANQKMQTYELMKYIATIAEEADIAKEYAERIEKIKEVYGIE